MKNCPPETALLFLYLDLSYPNLRGGKKERGEQGESEELENEPFENSSGEQVQPVTINSEDLYPWMLPEPQGWLQGPLL